MTTNTTSKITRFIWIEWIKAIALAWVFINHLAELCFGYPFISNPDANWPSFSERVAQLLPLSGYGVWNVPVNFIRYLGWFGDQGVQLFLIVSGFGLAWGLLSIGAGGSISYGDFIKKRAARLFPLWWGVHLLFIGTWILTGWGLSLGEKKLYFSLLGIRLTPSLFYYFSPAWWYFGLILQLYLIFPFLWKGLRRLGPGRLFVLAILVSLPIRTLGLFTFSEYLDVWQRGGMFITRLPEFVFGISFAAWLYEQPDRSAHKLRSARTVILLIIIYMAGIFGSLTLSGMIFSPLLLGVSLFTLLFISLEKLSERMPAWLSRPGNWVGEHSYSLYLLHHPIILRLVPMGALLTLSTVVRSITALSMTLILAVALEWCIAQAFSQMQRQVRNDGFPKTIYRLFIFGISLMMLLITGELAVRRFAPQEILGWGERPSLEPNDQLGWRLIPSSETRLRWLDYDYVVSANELGFPGPGFPVDRSSGTYRILVTGDAFTSAEGVDTDQAWPRLLQADLGNNVEVLNFSITGYGPNEYTAVIKQFVPIYKPDLIIVEFFVNDFFDVQASPQQFRESIGFDESDQNGIYSIVRLEHLRRYLRIQIFEPLGEIVLNKPRATGFFLGNFASFSKEQEPQITEGARLIAAKIGEIQNISERTNARLIAILVPASIQVCSPSKLAYFPKNVNFEDARQFNPELPQRLFFQMAKPLELRVYDLRNAFREGQECPYQARNMHWTAMGHQLVADYMKGILDTNGYIP